MAFLDDDQGAGAAKARQAAADARADLLSAEAVAALSLEIDALSALVIGKAIQFGQTRDGFLRHMADHFDARLVAYERMERAAIRLVAHRQAARAEREKAAEQAAAAAPAPPAEGGTTLAERGPPPGRIGAFAIENTGVSACGQVGCTISSPHDHAAPEQPSCKSGIVGCAITHPHDHGDVGGPDDVLDEE